MKPQIFFSCEPNCTRFYFLVACLRHPLIDVPFPVIALFHITHFPTGHIYPFLIGEEYIWIANVHTINDFLISTSSSTAPDTATTISSTTASKAPSATSAPVASFFLHRIDSTPAADTVRLV